jgi:hypothetical protein
MGHLFDEPTPARHVSFEPAGAYTLCHLDFTSLDEATGASAVLREIQPIMQAAAADRPLRVLTDVRGMAMSLAVVAALEEVARHNAGIVERSAIIGLAPLHRVALRQIRRLTGRDIREFGTRDEALTYLRAQPADELHLRGA